MHKFQYNKHSVGQNSFHIIWSPRYRINIFKPVIINKVFEGILNMIAQQKGYTIYELKIMDDHIHMFVELPPHTSVSTALQMFKGISSRILRRNYKWIRGIYPRGGMWSSGYFFRSVGSVTSNVIEHYIRNSNKNWKYFQGEAET